MRSNTATIVLAAGLILAPATRAYAGDVAIHDDFEVYQLRQPVTCAWLDTARVGGGDDLPGAPDPSVRLASTTDASGEPTRVLALENRRAFSRGILRAVPKSDTLYAMQLDVRIDRFSDSDEIALDFPMAAGALRVVPGHDPALGYVTNVYVDAGTQTWSLFHAGVNTGALVIDYGVPADLAKWYHVEFSLDASQGEVTVVVVEIQAGITLVDRTDAIPGWTAIEGDLDLMGVMAGEIDPTTTLANLAVYDNVRIFNGSSADQDGDGLIDTCQPVVVPDDTPSIQTAIDIAPDGGTVLVEPGIYLETIDFKGKAVRVRGVAGPDVTQIVGVGQFGRLVRCESGEGTDTVLQGFRIDSGAFGGMFVENAAPFVVDCVFSNNLSPASDGGAVLCHDANPAFVNCVFRNNFAQRGGAVAVIGGSPTLLSCLLRDNIAQLEGGAIFESGRGRFVNCTIVQNTADAGAGGLHKASRDGTSVLDSIVRENGGVQIEYVPTDPPPPPPPGTFPPVFQFPVAPFSVRFSNVEGGFAGTGNIDADPLFADPATNDFRLLAASPCVDAGGGQFQLADIHDLDGDGITAEGTPLDLDGGPRVSGDGVDMGAYETPGP